MLLFIIPFFIIFAINYIFNRLKNNKPIIISVDGNIGSGKSTLIKILRDRMKNYVFVDEPIKEWTEATDENDKNLLAHFYEDKNRWAYTFQNYAFITRSRNLLDSLNEQRKKIFNKGILEMIYDLFNNKKTIIFTERSTLTDRYVFADMLHSSGNINNLEWTMYMAWYDLFKTSLNIDHVIYLKTDPEKSYQRVSKRARDEESNISKNYLTDLHNKHEEWLNNQPNVLTLNGNLEFEDNEGNTLNLLNKINRYIDMM
jgi:deoxyguanosine kinase